MIPKVITVGHYKVRVKVSEPEIDARSNESRTDLLGQISMRDGMMVIRPELDHELEADTVLHEILHALFAVSALDGEFTREDEEKVVNHLTPLLIDTLRRNPGLCRYLGIA